MAQPAQPPANHTDAPQSRRAAGGKAYTLLRQLRHSASRCSILFTDTGIEIDGWRLERHKGPISNSAELDEFQNETSIHCPEMPFLSNHLTLRHLASGVVLRLDPRQALRQCAHDKNATAPEPPRHERGAAGAPHAAGVAPGRAPGAGAAAAGAPGVHPGLAGKHPSQLGGGAGSAAAGRAGGVSASSAPSRVQVSAASKWTAKSYEGLVEGGLKQIDFNFDWTYTTLYKGDVLEPPAGSDASPDASAAASPPLRPAGPDRVQPTSDEINVSLLTRPDPILWYDTIPLFEDELHDNGIALLSARVRVMEGCFLVLLQFFLRVDEQLMRVYDTRIFHQFGTDHCIREQTRKEDTFDALAKRGMPRTPSLYTDPMLVSRKLTLQATEREKISLAAPAASSAAAAP